jgi:hypothetical protein
MDHRDVVARRPDAPRSLGGRRLILDLKSRKVVWELSQSSTTRGDRNTRVFSGTVRLPAGTYEAFYAAFPSTYVQTEGDPGAMQRFMNWLADEGFDDFKLTSRDRRRSSAARRPNAPARKSPPAPSSRSAATAASFSQTGFLLDRPTEIEIYAVGEARENVEFDAGWHHAVGERDGYPRPRPLIDRSRRLDTRASPR